MKYLILFMLFLSACTPKNCVEYSEVTEVGGCDKYAHCAVRLKNGQKKYEYSPLTGDKVCVRRE